MHYALKGKHVPRKSTVVTNQTPNNFQIFYNKMNCNYYVTCDNMGI
jgi:hypothetical protein